VNRFLQPDLLQSVIVLYAGGAVRRVRILAQLPEGHRVCGRFHLRHYAVVIITPVGRVPG
jgi:hypothetical protein